MKEALKHISIKCHAVQFATSKRQVDCRLLSKRLDLLNTTKKLSHVNQNMPSSVSLVPRVRKPISGSHVSQFLPHHVQKTYY
jgi:hypothetical protein